MSVILTESVPKAGVPAYHRKIKCPGHYLIPPSVDVWKREPVPEMKYVSKSVMKHYKINNMRRAKDMFGRPIMDWKKIYELERQGIVKNPFITAAFAIEHIYDPKGSLCRMCDKRCKEGLGKINEMGIKRLHGS